MYYGYDANEQARSCLDFLDAHSRIPSGGGCVEAEPNTTLRRCGLTREAVMRAFGVRERDVARKAVESMWLDILERGVVFVDAYLEHLAKGGKASNPAIHKLALDLGYTKQFGTLMMYNHFGCLRPSNAVLIRFLNLGRDRLKKEGKRA